MVMVKKNKFLAVLLFVFSLSSCHLFDPKDDDKDLLAKLLYVLMGEWNHALFHYYPGLPGSSIVNNQFVLYNLDTKTTKKKVVFIHGWNLLERSGTPPTTNSEKIANIISTWDNAMYYYNNDNALWNEFDFYFFTYRTSDSVEKNGSRLITLLNEAFTSSDKVILVAHSMGGLVSKTALYHSANTNDVIDYLVTLGTPFYGSPFASSVYHEDLGALGELVSYFTSTDGGRDLAYTNLHQPIFLYGAYNLFLEGLNTQTAKDYKIYPYAGNLTTSTPTTCADADGEKTLVYISGCIILRDGPNGSVKFKDSDGIVPLESAKMASRANTPVIMAGYDHSMMSFKYTTNQTKSTDLFTTIIGKLQTFTF